MCGREFYIQCGILCPFIDFPCPILTIHVVMMIVDDPMTRRFFTHPLHSYIWSLREAMLPHRLPGQLENSALPCLPYCFSALLCEGGPGRPTFKFPMLQISSTVTRLKKEVNSIQVTRLTGLVMVPRLGP